MTNVYMTKSGFIEDEAMFKFFKEEAAIVAEQDIGRIDEGLEIIIYLLNKFPGIATRSSCAGHPDRTDSDDFHITTVVRDQESLDILEDIIYQYNLKLSPMFYDEKFYDFRKHLRIIKQGMLMGHYNGQSLTYPVVSIESWCGTITDDFHLKLLRDEILIKLMRYDSCDLFFGPELRAESGTPKEEVK